MNVREVPASPGTLAIPNGPGVAAILAACVGCFALSVIAIAADKSAALKSALAFYKPTGALSGVTTLAIAIWLTTWAILHWRWCKKTVASGPLHLAALTLLSLGLFLTFPPIGDLF
jgi:hypothetical protein